MNTTQHKQLSVSLVIPAYNDERYLKTALDSVASQTLMPNEVIVVDNNSTDNTARVASSFPFVKLIEEKRQGVGYASYKGFSVATGDLIARIDTDNVLEPNWVETAVQYFTTHEEISAITGRCEFYDIPFKRFFGVLHTFVHEYLQEMISGTIMLWGSNMVVRLDVWRDVIKGQTPPKIYEDLDMSLKLHKKGYRIRRVKSLVSGVSLVRGEMSPLYIWRYLKGWPRVYSDNNESYRSWLIAILKSLIYIILIPLDFIRYLDSKLSKWM